MDRRQFIQRVAVTAAGAGAASTVGASWLLGAAGAAGAAESPASAATREPFRFGDGRDWFFAARYGMFIHWGLYAIPGFHEQHQMRLRTPRSEYVKLAQQWNPARFDPDAWLDAAEAAGMKYICFTTKHHDGFCLWDTRHTDYNTMNTPYGKDVLAMLAKACHRRNVPLCLYYSVADWHHRNYPNQGRHHELPPQKGDEPNWDKYMDFLRAQVRELCTNYGKIRGFWWDMNVPKHKDASVNAMIRELQPDAVINNRGFDDGDFGTPERDYDKDESRTLSRPTEACQSVGQQSWGYRADEEYYTDRHLIRSIDRYLARGANYLLNVGPQPDGQLPAQAVAILGRIGAWLGKVRESFQDVRPASHLVNANSVLVTRRGSTLYIHVPDPLADAVSLKPLAVSPRRATLLNTGAAVRHVVEMTPSDHAQGKPYLHLRGLPANELSNQTLVVKLEFDDGALDAR